MVTNSHSIIEASGFCNKQSMLGPCQGVALEAMTLPVSRACVKTSQPTCQRSYTSNIQTRNQSNDYSVLILQRGNTLCSRSLLEAKCPNTQQCKQTKVSIVASYLKHEWLETFAEDAYTAPWRARDGLVMFDM